jgi:hypothetical protein
MSELEANRQESRPWLSWIVLLMLVGIALALRWRYIQEISLFVDEFVTAWAARNVPVHPLLLPSFPSGNIYPHGFLFTYLEVPFVLGEFDETLARIPGLIVSLAAVPVVYWIGRRLFSDPVGLIAAAVMAVDPDCIVWGGRARMYGLLQLLSLLVVYFYYRGLADDRPRDRYLAMILLVAAIFTHLEAAFLLPILGSATLVVLPWRRIWRWSVILPFVIGAAGAVAFYLVMNYGQPGHLQTLESEGRSYLELAADILKGPQAFAPVFTALHRLPVTILGLVGLGFLFRPRFDRSAPLTYLYIVFGAFVFLVVFLAGSFWQRERYLFLVLPLFFLISSAVLMRLLGLVPALRHPRPWQSALLALVVALFVGLTGAHTAYVQEWGYDQAFRYLREQQPKATDRIVTSMSTASMLYLGRNDAFAIQQGYEEYVKARPGDGLPADLWTATPIMTTTAAFTQVLETAPRVWFITDGWRFQTRYEPDFIQIVLDQMALEYNERGVMIFRADGYAPLPEPAIQRERRADFGEALALSGFGLSSGEPEPGDELEITLHWQALEDAGVAYTVALQLLAADGTGVSGIDESVLGGFYQPDFWPKGMTFADLHTLTLPADLPPGRYRLDLGLYATDGLVDLLPVGAPSEMGSGDRLPLAMLTVDQEITPPPGITPTYLDFGHQIRLLGYDLVRVANDTVRITLYWQALQPADRDYTVFAQLLDLGGNIVAQDDGPPGDPFFPTTTWLPGDVVADARTLSLPSGAPSADYTLLIGLYHQPSGERLNVTDAHGESQGDGLRLGPITLGSESP